MRGCPDSGPSQALDSIGRRWRRSNSRGGIFLLWCLGLFTLGVVEGEVSRKGDG